jgi:hypothetical protein
VQKVHENVIDKKTKKSKAPFFCHFFVDNFFRMIFFTTFSMDSNSASNSGFFNTYIAF